MNRFLKLLHFIALALFLGSILSWIVLTKASAHQPLPQLALIRQIMHTGTWALTVPGMWLMLLTGLILGYRRYGLRSRFFQLKLALMLIIVVNATLVVVPALDQAHQLAQAALQSGALSPDFAAATQRETAAGSVNVLLIVAAACVGIWRTGARRQA